MIKFRTPHPSAKGIVFPKSKINAMVRHGASKKALAEANRFPIEVNSIAGIKNCANKHEMKRILSAANLSTTDSLENTPENREIFKRNGWNVVFKLFNHRRGIGMRFLPIAEIDTLADERGLIERRINVKREWRVHACPLLKETYVLEKRRRHDAQGPARNIENCVFREIDGGDVPPPPNGWDEALQLCLDSVSTLGLDTGAVDLAWSGNKFYVIEVNSGPGLGDKSRAWYQDKYIRLVEEKAKNI